MNKKMLMITALVSVVALGGTFAISFMVSKKFNTLKEELAKQQATEEKPVTPQARLLKEMTDVTEEKPITMALGEDQLQNLIREVRDKIHTYNTRLIELRKSEERLQSAQRSLRDDIDELTGLQTELASTVAELKRQKVLLKQTRIEIAKSEKDNLEKIAAAYDKMKPAGAAEIFTNMTKLETSETRGLEEVIKIMNYMTDRTKAKVLESLVSTQPQLAAVLSTELKRVKEVVD